jgi:hypothetical protein
MKCEMHPTPLPRGPLQNRLDGALEAPVRVAGHEPHPTEPPGHQRAQKRRPESPILAGTHVEAQHLPLAALSVHPDGYDHRRRCHVSVLAGFEVGGVDPHVGVRALQRPVTEALDLFVEFFAQLRDPALGDALHPEGFDQAVHLARGNPMHVRFLHDRRQCPLGPPSRLQERGEVARVPHPRHFQFDRADPGVPVPLPVSVALPHAPGAALVARSAHVLLDLHLHERLGEHPNAFFEEVRVPIDRGLAQQLLKSYPQFIGHRCLRPLDWSLRKEPHGGRLRQRPIRFLHTYSDTTQVWKLRYSTFARRRSGSQ